MVKQFPEFVDAIERIVGSTDKGVFVDGRVHEEFVDLCRGKLARSIWPGFFKSYQDSLRTDKHRSGSSLFHENGFTKISLWKFPWGGQLRLHIWPKGEYIDSRIHSHRWNLSSYLMSGTLTAINYNDPDRDADRDDSSVPLSKLYDADDGGIKPAEYIGSKSLTPAAVYTVADGGGHFADYRVLHRVRKSSADIAISLMLSGRAASDYSIVSEILPGHQATARRPLSIEQIERSLDQVAAA